MNVENNCSTFNIRSFTEKKGMIMGMFWLKDEKETNYSTICLSYNNKIYEDLYTTVCSTLGSVL